MNNNINDGLEFRIAMEELVLSAQKKKNTIQNYANRSRIRTGYVPLVLRYRLTHARKIYRLIESVYDKVVKNEKYEK